MKLRLIPPIMLILFPYLLILPFLTGVFRIYVDYGDFYFPVVLVGFISALFLNALNALINKWDVEKLALWNLVIKLALIPFYCFIFVFGIGVMIAIPLLFVLDGAIMLASSSYGICGLIQAKKTPFLRSLHFWLLLIPHFVFVMDVIAAIVFKIKCKYL